MLFRSGAKVVIHGTIQPARCDFGHRASVEIRHPASDTGEAVLRIGVPNKAASDFDTVGYRSPVARGDVQGNAGRGFSGCVARADRE